MKFVDINFMSIILKELFYFILFKNFFLYYIPVTPLTKCSQFIKFQSNYQPNGRFQCLQIFRCYTSLFVKCVFCNQSNFFSKNFLMFFIFQKSAYYDNDPYNDLRLKRSQITLPWHSIVISLFYSKKL